MPLLSWFFRKPSEEDYEQVLASLALSIQKRQTKLSEIRLRERRATLLVTTWAFAAWVAYVGLWWAGVAGSRSRGLGGVLWGLPVVVGPVVVLFTRRIVQLWYNRIGNAEEKTLRELLVQQRNKIEEIKKKTNYYTTKNLLDRYDDGLVRRDSVNSASTPQTPQQRAPQSPAHPASLHPGKPNGSGTPTQQRQAPPTPQTPAKSPSQAQPGSPALPPMPAPKKQWYDKLADALLGDEPATTGPSPASRYALICERCFSHNGLVKEDQWEYTQYVCPKCGHFNVSARVRKAGGRTIGSMSTQSAPMPWSGPPRLPAQPQDIAPGSTATSARSPSVQDQPDHQELSPGVVAGTSSSDDHGRDGEGKSEGEANKTMQMEVDS